MKTALETRPTTGTKTDGKQDAERALLPGIASPADVKRIPKEQVGALCRELRATMTEHTLRNGGHLASSLGAVEMTVAIHRVFRAPEDHVIFDVGHQAYAHKLLTGRYGRFATLRQPGGLSGFPKRSESPYDAYGAGHASTSLSAGLGFAEADRLRGSDCWTVVVMGDGALTGGMSYEALNNCGRNLHLILILNENEMSITRNVGHMAQQLTRLRMSRGYLRTKTALERVLEGTPLIGKPIYGFLHRLKSRAKNYFYNSNYFENMGLYYIGPADGNNEETVEQLLETAKAKNRSCVIHLKTKKGKGYEPAEKNPAYYHGLAPAEKRDLLSAEQNRGFSVTFGETLTDLAAKDSRICAITAAMRNGTGLDSFFRAHPERAFDVGIAEEHALTFAAGLSAAGYVPAVAVYSTFLQRAYDQIIHDVALQNLPVLIGIDRAGLAIADGVTHHGIFDVAALLQLPNVELYAPMTTAAEENKIRTLLQRGLASPTAIRYPSGGDIQTLVAYLNREEIRCPLPDVYTDFDVQRPPRLVAVGYGTFCADLVAAGGENPEVGFLMTERLAPQDDIVKLLRTLIKNGTRAFLFGEEAVENGGFGMLLCARLAQRETVDFPLPYTRVLAIRNPFAEVLPRECVKEAYGIGLSQIRAAIADALAFLHNG